MERYYDGDQEALFKAAHVINPYVKPKKEAKVTTHVVFVRRVASAMPSTFTHIHLDAMASRACVKIFFTLAVPTRSLPGKTCSSLNFP